MRQKPQSVLLPHLRSYTLLEVWISGGKNYCRPYCRLANIICFLDPKDLYLFYMQNTLTLFQGPQKLHPIRASTFSGFHPEFHYFSQIQMQMRLLGSNSLSIFINDSSALSKHLWMKDKLSVLYRSNIPWWDRPRKTAINLSIQKRRKQEAHRSYWSIAILNSSRAHIDSEIKQFPNLGILLCGSWFCPLSHPYFFMKGSLCL